MLTIIKDCIYRFVEVPDICKTIIDTYEFQRLRNIKQLGFVHMVYPSAVHTRFEHSLGVMHLAGKVIDILRSSGVSITDREKELVQTAGLLHDVGHIAFSHLLDYILEEEGETEKHEDRSIIILRIINTKLNLFTSQELVKIEKMIKGLWQTERKPFLFQIVCNTQCGLDVDRFDYLQRDSYHTGIPSFQPDYLIHCIRVKNGHLAFLPKAKEEIKLLFEARKRMFTLVYRHKTVMKIERVIRKIIMDLKLTKDWNKVNWLDLDDGDLMYLLKRHQDYKQIYYRSWDKTAVQNKYDHCVGLEECEIKYLMSSVVYCV